MVAKRRAAEDATFRDLSVTTDFDGTVPFDETEVAKAMTERETRAAHGNA